MARLIRHVALFDDGGNVCSFGPDSDVPDWAVALITNPEVWDDTESIEAPVVVEPIPPAAVVEPVTIEPVTEPEAPAVEPVVAAEPVAEPEPARVPVGDPPPQNGPGAGRQLWADYAEANGVTVQSDWKREAIIEACELAGVAV